MSVSPFKIAAEDLNYLNLGHNLELGNSVRDFFNDPANDYLWLISTVRQTVTHALRHTESINLRYLDGGEKYKTTTEANQHMEVATSSASLIPVFKYAVEWFTEILKSTGADNVEFGRVFISKLAPRAKIDLHTDEGRYFSHYDRFHFTVTAADENVFCIRGEQCILQPDTLYWVNNHVPHWLENKSDIARINFIIDARLT